MDRRRYLRLAGGALVGGGSTALAGCTSSCPDTDPPSPQETLAFGATPTGPLPREPTGEWPTAHATPGRTGFASGSLPLEPSLQWRTSLSLPATDEGALSASAPTVGQGRVFVSDAERVHSLDLRTGTVNWTSDRLSPTIHDTLTAYEANTVAPTVGPDGTVYVGTAGGLVALDASTGEVTWSTDDMTDVAPPVITDAVIAVGREMITAVEPGGTERWRRPIDRGEPPIPPAADSSTVVVVTGEGLRALGVGTGEERWSRTLSVESYPVVADGTCYAGTFDGLHALDLATGEQRWLYSRGEHLALHTPVFADDTIYVVEQTGEAGAASFALERTTERPVERWCSYIGSGAVVGATAEHVLGSLPLGEGPDARQGIVAFTADLGQVVWALAGGSSPRGWVTPPAILDGTVVATTRGGTTVALGGG